MKQLLLSCIAMAVITAPAAADYRRIGPGLELKQAKAYCNLASMGVGSGVYAYGSTAFVAGAAIGNAIGNMIAQSQVYDNCMTLQGWEYYRAAYKAPKVKGNWIGGDNTAKKN